MPESLWCSDCNGYTTHTFEGHLEWAEEWKEAMSSETERPDHLWAGDGFGHNCVRCPDDSPWRCDPAKHPAVDFIRRVVEAIEPGVTEGMDDDELLVMHQRIKADREGKLA